MSPARKQMQGFAGFPAGKLSTTPVPNQFFSELLPLVEDVEILRNILYSGVWIRYRQKQATPDRKQAKLKESDHEQRSV